MQKQQLIEYLSIWGDWTEKGVPQLGYSGMSPVARLLHSPGRSTKPLVGPVYESNPVAQAVQDAVERIQGTMQRTLWLRYVEKLERRICAKQMSITVGQWDWSLEKAHNHINRELRL